MPHVLCSPFCQTHLRKGGFTTHSHLLREFQGSRSLVQLRHFVDWELGEPQECGESSAHRAGWEQKNCQGSISSKGFIILFLNNFFFLIGRNTVSYQALQKGLWCHITPPGTGSCCPFVHVALPGHKWDLGVYDPTDRSAHVLEPDGFLP